MGTEVALSKVIDHVESAIYRNQYVLGLFFDIMGAFDQVCIQGIIDEMSKRGFPTQFIKWYGHYLKHRKLEARILGVKVSRFLVQGCLQGGVILPITWNVVIDILLQRLKDQKCQNSLKGSGIVIGFADDGLALIQGIDPCTIVSIGQKILDKAKEWGDDFYLKFSEEKTLAMMFTLRKLEKLPVKLELKLNNKNINFTSSIKYLGLTLTPNLSWKENL